MSLRIDAARIVAAIRTAAEDRGREVGANVR